MRSRQVIILVAIIFFLLVLFGLRGSSKQLVRLAGSTAFLPFAEQLAEVYMTHHPDVVSIEVQGGGSATGIMASLAGIVDVGMVDLLQLPKETDTLSHVVVARDGIAVVVHPTNPLIDLSFDQLNDIFSGKITNWKELGGADAPIRVISREEGSGTRTSFDTLVLKEKRLVSNAMFQDSNGTIREAIMQDPRAIGYISIGFLVPGVKALSVAGVTATNDHVIAGSYTIARPVYFLLQPHPTAQTRAFVDYVLSSEGQGLIQKNGLIPVNL